MNITMVWVIYVLCISAMMISKATGKDCYSCEFVRFKVSGDLTTDEISAVLKDEKGDEECYTNDIVDSECSTDGSCYKIATTTSITVEVPLVSGEINIEYAKRGCNDLTVLEKCEVEITTSLEQFVSPLTQKIKDILPKSTDAEAELDLSCCASHLCNGPAPPPKENQLENGNESSAGMRHSALMYLVAMPFLFLL